MSKIVEFIDEEFGVIYIEIANVEGKSGWKDISATDKVSTITGKVQDCLSSVKAFAKGSFQSLSELKPDEIEIKAGVKFTIKEGKLIGLFAQAEGEFPFEVTLKWKNKNVTN